MCAPGQKSGCARDRAFWSSYPASRICSAHGCFLHFALCLAPTMPCAQSRPDVAPYARMHADAVWNAMAALLCEVPPQDHARAVATLPAALGGLGLLSAARTAPAAYWAGWADALPVLRKRPLVLAEARAGFLADGGGGAVSFNIPRLFRGGRWKMNNSFFNVPPWCFTQLSV